MPKFFVSSSQIENNKIKVVGHDVNHIKNVLRAKVDDIFEICDKDNSKNYLCSVRDFNNESIVFEIVKECDNNVESNIEVTVFQGLPKSDKMELIIQKSVELGVFDIVPVEMKRSVVKLNDKDRLKKIQRWQKISEVAAKQCGRDLIPNINNFMNIRNIGDLFYMYDLILLAYEGEQNNKIKDELKKIKITDNEKYKIGVIIGPEGGFDDSEVDYLKNERCKSSYFG